MGHQSANERDRWTGWVSFAWVLAALACFSGIFLIATIGFIEVPRASGFGTERQASPFVWALAISQSIGAIMLAVLFSMINSIYQNTCSQKQRQSSSATVSTAISSMDPAEDEPIMEGVLVKGINDNSPIKGKIADNWWLVEVNDNKINGANEVSKLLKVGLNRLVFKTSRNERQFVSVKLNSPPRLGLFLE